MTLPNSVRLSDIVDGMEMQSDEMTAYFHRPTGRVVAIREEAFMAADDDDPEFAEDEEFAEARAILNDEDAVERNYLALPDRFEIDEYGMMERFASGVAHENERDQLLSALNGKGAFRRFKDTVVRLDLAKLWYAAREQEYERVAREWCEAHGIEVDQHTTHH